MTKTYTKIIRNYIISPFKKKNTLSKTRSQPGYIFSNIACPLHCINHHPIPSGLCRRWRLPTCITGIEALERTEPKITACVRLWFFGGKRDGCFRKWWYPQIIQCNRVSIINHPFWGTPYFWKHPFVAYEKPLVVFFLINGRLWNHETRPGYFFGGGSTLGGEKWVDQA